MKRLVVVLAVCAVPVVALAADCPGVNFGCCVSLCFGQTGEPACQATLNKLHDELRKGRGFPSCDEDQVVHPRNGEQVIATVLGSAAANAGESHALPAGSPRVEQRVAAQGERYTRSTHHGDKGNALAEHWLVHGAAHAWSGAGCHARAEEGASAPVAQRH